MGESKVSTKINFKYEDADETIEEAVTTTGSSNLEEDSTMSEQPEDSSMVVVVGGDKTSADYYFDSYSHFGKLITFYYLSVNRNQPISKI